MSPSRPQSRSSSGAPPLSDGGSRRFRSVGALVAGWIWMVFAALNLADLAARGRDLASLVAAAVLLFGCAVVYALLLRPRIVAGPERLRVLNPLRTFTVPWPTVRRIELTGVVSAITVVTEGTPIRAWALQTGPKRRRHRRQVGGRFHVAASDPSAVASGLSTPDFKGEEAYRSGGRAVPRGVADAAHGRTHTDFVVEQLTELAAMHGRARRRTGAGSAGAADTNPERPSAAWALDAIIALAATGAFLAGALIVALI